MKTDGAKDRRQFDRFELKIFGSMNSFTVALNKGLFLDCSLINLSQGGVKVRINTDRKKLPEISEGQSVEFRSFLDDKHGYLRGRKGRVVWIDIESLEFGVVFDEPMPVESFLEHLEI
jgi:hypothetical protein